jgi:hypothetical protein
LTNWFLYDDLSGNTWIQTKDDVTHCPICDELITFIGYSGRHCGYKYKTYFGVLRLMTPYAKHNKQSGRGWQSVRRITVDEIRKWANEVSGKKDAKKLVRLKNG